MSRLIDADELEKIMTEDWFLDILLTQNGKSDIAKKLTDMIDSVPLAYDVEKVVVEIEKESVVSDGFLIIHTEEACDIVKSGGTDLGYNPYQE